MRWPPLTQIVNGVGSLYGECMARRISTTIRLDAEDVLALKRARAGEYLTFSRSVRAMASQRFSQRSSVFQEYMCFALWKSLLATYG